MPDGLILTESHLAALKKAKADKAANASSTARAAKMMGMLRRTRTGSATAGRRLHHQPGLSLRPRPCSRGRGARVNDRASSSILALVATNTKPPTGFVDIAGVLRNRPRIERRLSSSPTISPVFSLGDDMQQHNEEDRQTHGSPLDRFE